MILIKERFISIKFILVLLSVIAWSFASLAQADFSPYVSNPVFSYSGVAGTFDQNQIRYKDVIKVGNEYWMYYTALQNSNFMNIGLATSLDGISWTRHSSAPVFRCGENLLVTCSTSNWSAYKVIVISVINEGGMFKMWYLGTNQNLSGTNRLGFATSSDGLNWTAYPNNPVFDTGYSGNNFVAGVIKMNDQYHLYYTKGSNQKDVFLARSNDGISWENYSTEPVLSVTDSVGAADLLGNAVVVPDRLSGAVYVSEDGFSFEHTATITPRIGNDIFFNWSALILEGSIVKNYYHIQDGNVIWSGGNHSVGLATTTLQDFGLSQPEVPKTIEELIGELDETVREDVADTATQNSYLAHVKKLLKFFDGSQTEAFINQLTGLLKKLPFDRAKDNLESGVADDIEEISNELLEKVSETVSAAWDVPLITQIASLYSPGSAEWQSDLLGNGLLDPFCGNTIGGCGCAITSLTMVARAFGITHGIDGSEVNPRNVNTWLANNDGYDAVNNVKWGKALEYFSNGGGLSHVSFTKYVEDNGVIGEHLTEGGLAVAYEAAKGHYIALTEALGGGGFAIRDPLWYETKTTNDAKDIANHVQNYGGDVDKAKLFAYADTPKPLPAMIEIHLNSPAELLLIDSMGRKTGYDPETETFVNEIPGGAYDRTEVIASSDVVPAEAHATKVLFVNAPLEDLYELQVIGTGEGAYTLDVFTTGGRLASETSVITDTTEGGLVHRYAIDIPDEQKQSRAPERLRELADTKELEKPEVAQKLRDIAARLDGDNAAETSLDLMAEIAG